MNFFLKHREAFLLVLILAVLAGATSVLYSSLETDRSAERARQERFMRNAAFSVVDDLGSELFTMVSTFSSDLNTYRDNGRPIDRRLIEETVTRYRNQARFPDLLQDLACVEKASDGGWTFHRWDAAGWSAGDRPVWAEDLEAPTVPADAHPNHLAFSLEKPVVTLRLGPRNPFPGEVAAVALRFNPQVVLGQIVPTLVRQRFSESQDAQPYKASVHNRNIAEVNTALPADWEVPLLSWTPFEGWFDYYLNRLKTMDRSRLAFERMAANPGETFDGTGWSLRVTRLPRGLEAEMESLQQKNLLVALAFFLILALGFLGFYRIAWQARTRAQQERTFLALVSHELKTPLAVVRSLAENLTAGIGTSEERAREYGEVILLESERLSRMVSNVLGMTALQGGLSADELSGVDFAAVVRDRVAREQPVSDDVRLQVRIHPGLAPVLAHPAALTAAVDNLVGNAFRHGTGGDRPHLLSIVLEPRIRWGRRGVELVVEDNGPGFTFWEGLSFLRPFRRGSRAWDAQTPGGGLGLSLVRTTAQALGGRLTWVSHPGRGSKFILWLRERK